MPCHRKPQLTNEKLLSDLLSMVSDLHPPNPDATTTIDASVTSPSLSSLKDKLAAAAGDLSQIPLTAIICHSCRPVATATATVTSKRTRFVAGMLNAVKDASTNPLATRFIHHRSVLGAGSQDELDTLYEIATKIGGSLDASCGVTNEKWREDHHAGTSQKSPQQASLSFGEDVDRVAETSAFRSEVSRSTNENRGSVHIVHAKDARTMRKMTSLLDALEVRTRERITRLGEQGSMVSGGVFDSWGYDSDLDVIHGRARLARERASHD